MSAMIANDALSISVKTKILLRSEMSVISVAEDHGLPLCKILGNLMMNPSYLLTTLTAANVQMFLSALTFYAPGYALEVITEKKETVDICFSITVITAPILGAVLGGFLTDRCIGSYEDKRAIRMCMLVFLAYTLISIPGPLTKNIILWFGILWMTLFLTGFIQPVLMGIILTSVSQI